MKSYDEREIRDLLTPRDAPEPPAGLAERIKSEIPELDDIETAPAAGVPSRRRPRRRFYLLAASVVLALGAGFLALRLRPALQPQDVLAVRDAAESPPATAAAAAPAASEARAQRESAPPAVGAAAEPPVTRGDSRSTQPMHEQSRSPRESADADAAVPEALREVRESALSRLRSASAAEPASDASDRSDISDVSAESGAFADSGDTLLRGEASAGLAPASTAKRTRGDDETYRRFVAEQPPLQRRAEELQRQLEEKRTQLLSFEAGARAGSERDLETPASPVPPALVPASSLPNEAPYDDIYFQDYGTNPFIDTEDDALSTFGLDVDTASYTVVRRFLRDGHLPRPEAVRVEELVNYFDYGDAPPERGDFAIYAEGAPSLYGEGDRYYLLRFHLRGRELDTEERRPAHLTFVVDVSGSMAKQNRLGLVRQALELLVGQLRGDDRVALVVYGTRGRVVLDHTSDRERVRRALAELRTEGSTNAEEGLLLGYELATRARRDGATNRVILCSDGVANVGSTSAESILERVGAYAGLGIELTTVGFGMGNYNDVLMEQLADRGNGRYSYVDTLEEARRIFVENLTGTLQTIAAEARVQVDFNPDVVSRYRLLGYENRDIADERFRDDSVDAGEIGAGHAVTALYEIKLEDPPGGDEIATLRLRYGSVIGGEIVETSHRVSFEDLAETWEGASPALRLTALVAEFGEILKRSYWSRTGDLDDVFRRAQRVALEFPGDAEVAEFVSLAGQAARLKMKGR